MLRFIRFLSAMLALSCVSTGCAQQAAEVTASSTTQSAVAPAGTLVRPTGGSTDPDLDKPWQTYKSAIAEATKLLRGSIESQRHAARTRGDLQSATRFKAIIDALDQKGDMPDCKELEKETATTQDSFKRAAEALDMAYAAVVRKLTMDASLDESIAQAVEDERRDLSAFVGGGWQDVTKDLIGGDRQDRGIVLNEIFPRMRTKGTLKPPVEIEYVCMTEKNNIRLGYACTEMIFNWELRPDTLAIGGGPAHNIRGVPGAGRVPAGQFLTIRQVVLPNEMSVFVDGQQRASWKADFSKIDEPVEVFRADSDLVVKSIRIKRPPKEMPAGAKQGPAAAAPPVKDPLAFFFRPLTRPADGSKDEELEKPWQAYEAATRQATKRLHDAIETKRQAARAAGDLASASRLKAAGAVLDQKGEMPDCKEVENEVAATQDSYQRAAEELDKAYAALVKKLTANTSLDESVAQAVENERVSLLGADKPIDLIPLVDLTGGATLGTWVRRDGEVRASRGDGSKTTISCRVPAEYDFEIEATCFGNTDFRQLCSVGDATIQWCVGAWRVAGFETVGDKPLQQTGKAIPGGLRPQTRYKSTVKVRRGRISGFVNDVEVVSHATDSSDLKVLPAWSIPKGRLGLAAWGADVVFHKAVLIPRRGSTTGSITIAAPPRKSESTNDQSPVGVLARPNGSRKDPLLDEAWQVYTASIKEATSKLREAIESQRQAARAKGDLDSATRFKTMLSAFDQQGALPYCVELEKENAVARASFKQAAAILDSAYIAVVKKLTVDTSIDESAAQAVEDERKRLASGTSGQSPPKEAAAFGKHRYMLFPDDAISWEEAKKKCDEMGGHLVTITSPEENEFVFRLTGGRRCWIGMYYDPKQSKHVWVTDEPARYVRWRPSQPNGGDQIYVGISCFQTAEWEDYTSQPPDSQGFMCEWDHE